jgi:hypothetical protein
VAITAPAANATVSGVVTVAATATDNVGVAGVQFRLDGAALGPEDAIAPFATAWSTATAPVGAHTLTAVAWDAAGNQRTSAGIVVTVSNPQVRLAWTASPDTAVSGYTVHVADASRIYSTRLTVGNVTAYTVAGLQPGQLYYFAVTAHTATALESVASNEVTTTTP